MKFLELAKKVLSEVKKPMSASEIWTYANDKSYTNQLETSGRTPDFTLSARLYSAVKDKTNKTFSSIGERPKRFYLLGITPSVALKIDETGEGEKDAIRDQKIKYKEKDLHQVLAYFIYTRFRAFPKTINHSKSTKKQFGEWLHPDMVACYFPTNHWKTNAYELSQDFGDVQIALFSFEIKLRLSFSNLRESFFQAVSNSSWAHNGFLVAAEIDKDIEFQEELERLSRSFGIGVIELKLDDPDASNVIYDSAETEVIDWDMVSKLTMNKDFSDFIERIKKDMKSKEVREDWYDKFMESEDLINFFKNKL